MPLPPNPVAAAGSPRPFSAPIWLPWVCAPMFFLLPIGGCGIAGTMRRPPIATTEVTARPPLPGPVPMATVATVMTPRR